MRWSLRELGEVVLEQRSEDLIALGGVHRRIGGAMCGALAGEAGEASKASSCAVTLVSARLWLPIR
jgi:hypothetical protein